MVEESSGIERWVGVGVSAETSSLQDQMRLVARVQVINSPTMSVIHTTPIFFLNYSKQILILTVVKGTHCLGLDELGYTKHL